MTPGANVGSDGTTFLVWAPASKRVDVVIHHSDHETDHPMQAAGNGYFSLTLDAPPGTLYRYRLDGGPAYPDPASRYQPRGVHGPSEVIDPNGYRWGDERWEGIRPDRLSIYELHVGTFTPEGTFQAAAERLDYLVELGITAIEVMPIANFPGERNWGYDGVNLYAPATAYGRPDDFRRFVDLAHQKGIAVLLDVVYNHLGPEGNYIPAVTSGRFFTDRHHTPWGSAVNFDGPDSDAVRAFIVYNASHWFDEYHIDGLRLDATHAILDDSPNHILKVLAETAWLADRYPRILIAEDERNDPKLLRDFARSGYDLDGVWSDDLHHAVRRLTAGDDEGYYADYHGSAKEIASILELGWRPIDRVAEGADEIDPPAFVHCIQNHDQVGNRATGDRLHHEIDLATYRALSALLLLSPYTPLLFMGQEWAASSPFLYFTHHPEELGRKVTAGRRAEFKRFSAFSDPAARDRIPDPQAIGTHEESVLDWSEPRRTGHSGVLDLYRELLRLRHGHPALQTSAREGFAVEPVGEATLVLRRRKGDSELLAIVNLRGETRLDPRALDVLGEEWDGGWSPILVSEDPRFGGAGDWGRAEDGGWVHLVRPCALVFERRS